MQDRAQLVGANPKLARLVAVDLDGRLDGGVQVALDADKGSVAADCPRQTRRPNPQLRRRSRLHGQLIGASARLAAHPGVLLRRDDAFDPGHRAQLSAQVRQDLLQMRAIGSRLQLDKEPPFAEARRAGSTDLRDHVGNIERAAERLFDPALQRAHRREGNVVAGASRDLDLAGIVLGEEALRDDAEKPTRRDNADQEQD